MYSCLLLGSWCNILFFSMYPVVSCVSGPQSGGKGKLMGRSKITVKIK